MNDLRIEEWRFDVPGKGSRLARGRIEPGVCIALSGPSGCGKTSFLKSLSGLRPPQSGRLFLGNQELSSLPPDKRRVGYSFQGGALFPHLDIAANLEFPLRFVSESRSWDSSLRRRKVIEALERFGLSSLAAQYPSQLSGGERQRVALLRMSLAAPSWLLLDEPFSALDDVSRETFIVWLKAFLAEKSLPTLVVTHRLEEARVLAQKVVTWPASESEPLQF